MNQNNLRQSIDNVMSLQREANKNIRSVQYRKTLIKVAMVFQGRHEELVSLLEEQMSKLSENLEYESAGIIRDQIKTLGEHEIEINPYIGISKIFTITVNKN